VEYNIIQYNSDFYRAMRYKVSKRRIVIYLYWYYVSHN